MLCFVDLRFFYRNKQKTCCDVRDKYFNLEKKLVCKGTKYIMKKERSRIMDDRLLYRTVTLIIKWQRFFRIEPLVQARKNL